MEELEEMEPGFAIRFDEEWERIFNKKKDPVLPIGDEKVRNSAKRWAHDGTRTRTHVDMSRRSDPIHQDREGTSHQAQSLAGHDRHFDTPANTTANTTRRAANTTANTQLKAHAVIRATTTARTTSTGLSKWRSGRGEIDGSKENYTRATNQGRCPFPQGANRQQMRNQRLMSEEMQWKYEVDEFGEANAIDNELKIRRWVTYTRW
jgi:hypothetical protein